MGRVRKRDIKISKACTLQVSKKMTAVYSDVIYMCMVIGAIIKKRYIEILKNTTDKSKWNSKIYSINQQ